MKNARRLALSLASLLLVSTSAHAARRSENVEQAVPAGGVRKVRLENVNGDVRIVPGPADKIRIHAEKSVTGGDAERLLSELQVKIEASGGVLQIETRPPKRRKFLGMFDLGGSNGTRVDYRIEVPADREVDLVTVNGAIESSGLTSTLHAETVNGSVRVSQASGTVSVTTVNGSVRVERRSVEGTKVETVNGDVEIVWPRGGSFSYDLETLTGRVEADFGTAASGNVSGRSAQGQVGSGGNVSLRAETVNGSIRVKAN